MANNKTNYLEGKIIEHVLRNVSFTSPTTVYMSLHTADPTETGSHTNEVSDGGGSLYARQAVTFGAESGGVCLNSADVTFPVAGTNWGSITHIGIEDGGTAGAGNMLYYGPLDNSVTINTGNQFKAATGQISVAEL